MICNRPKRSFAFSFWHCSTSGCCHVSLILLVKTRHTGKSSHHLIFGISLPLAVQLSRQPVKPPECSSECVNWMLNVRMYEDSLKEVSLEVIPIKHRLQNEDRQPRFEQKTYKMFNTSFVMQLKITLPKFIPLPTTQQLMSQLQISYYMTLFHSHTRLKNLIY